MRASRPVSVEVPPALLRVVWSISPEAAVSAGLCAPTPGPVELAWTVDPASEDATATLHVGADSRVLCTTRAIMEHDESGMLHLTTPDRAFLAAIDGSERGRVLYAYTALLGSLGVPGGRYQVVQPRRNAGE